MNRISQAFDLQVNGYAGVDLNGDFTIDELRAVCQRMQADGVTAFLATVITAPVQRMVRQISRLAEAIGSDDLVAASMVGIHVEGPFLSPMPGYVGAHPVDAILAADIDIAQRLIEAGQGTVKLMTLAPEQDPMGKVTRWLSHQGIVIAGGHSDASLDQLKRTLDAGMKLYTHLGNGCPATLPRHDNIIQRVLSLADRLFISFIADGHHVPRFALRNYLSLVPDDRIIIVTDAISAAGLGPGKYRLSDQWVEVDESGAAWAECRTHFAGCASTMVQMQAVLDSIHIDASAQQRYLWDNPRALLNLFK